VLRVTSTLAIDPSEIEEVFVRASGPGGQNVNKVATAVQLRFDAARSSALSPPIRKRLREIAGKRMTAEGMLIITGDRFRSQARNREDARQRLIALLRKAATPVKPRRATKPPEASKIQRRESKRRRSVLKASRRPPLPGD
jgi:ribosome-associated protein